MYYLDDDVVVECVRGFDVECELCLFFHGTKKNENNLAIDGLNKSPGKHSMTKCHYEYYSLIYIKKAFTNVLD